MWFLWLGIPVLYALAEVFSHMGTTCVLSIGTKQMIVLLTRMGCAYLITRWISVVPDIKKDSHLDTDPHSLIYTIILYVMKGICAALAEAAILYVSSQRIKSKIKMMYCCLAMYPLLAYLWIQVFQDQISIKWNQVMACVLFVIAFHLF